MEKLDNNWILKDGGKSSECPVEFSAPATLGLTNMAGVYNILAMVEIIAIKMFWSFFL